MNCRSAFWLLAALALIASACSSPGLTTEQKEEVDRQMDLARSLVNSSDYRRATHIYAIIAENYPLSPQGVIAAQRVAMLYARPGNLERNDSLALHWYRTAFARLQSTDEREQAQICMFLLDRSLSHKQELRRTRAIADSLQLLLRRQSAMIASQTRRMGDLERALGTTSSELRRMKDVDIQISRSQQDRR